MDAAEQILFTLLKKYRIKNRREFFNCELKIIINNLKKVESILIESDKLKSEIETTTAENKMIETPSININITNIQPNITNIQPNITNIQPNNRNQCPKCLKSFARPSILRSHLKLQNECSMKLTKLVCQVCQKEFSRKFYLDKHLEKHKNNSINQSQNQPIKTLFPIKLKLKTDQQPLQNDNDLGNKLHFF
jgi:hypothetical protein